MRNGILRGRMYGIGGQGIRVPTKSKRNLSKGRISKRAGLSTRGLGRVCAHVCVAQHKVWLYKEKALFFLSCSNCEPGL